MEVRFKAIVKGNIPANRLVTLAGRTDEGVILVELANRTAAADFVSTGDLTDGQEINVTLKDGLRFWEVEAEIDLLAGQWVSVGTDGKAHHRVGNTRENVGITLNSAKAGEIAKVLRRESLDNQWSKEVNQDLEDLKARVSDLETGGEST